MGSTPVAAVNTAAKRIALASLLCAVPVCARLFAAAGAAEPAGGASCAGWVRLSAIAQSGTVREHNMQGSFAELLDTRNGAVVTRSTLAGMRESAGSNGNEGWTQDFSGTSHWLDSDHARAVARTNAWLNRRGWCSANAAGDSLQQSTRKQDGHTYAVVRAVPRGGVPADIWFDAGTGLPDRTVVRLNEDTLAVHFSDWREAAGTVIPFERRIEYVEDGDVTTMTTDSVASIPSPRAGAFDLPPTTNSVTMLHAARSTTVPMHIEGRKMLVNVELNGQGPFPFVFDTGGHFIVTAATAKRLALEVAGRGEGAGAERRDGFARVKELRIGDAVIRNDVAHVIAYSFGRLERGSKPPKAGWLGLELLERFSVVIDPDKQTLTLTPLAASPRAYAGLRIPLVLDEDAPLVKCRIDGLPGQCMIDTGNAGPTIVEGYWARRAGLPHLPRSLDAGDGVRIARADLDMGALHLPHEIVAAYPQDTSGSESTTVEAGIFSETIHDRFITSIDYSQKAMWLSPIPSAAPPVFNRTGLQTVKQPDGAFKVTFVFAGSPAAAAGFKAGDSIVSIDGKPASAWSSSEFAAASVAPVGTVRTYGTTRAGTTAVRVVRVRLVEMLP